MNKILDKVSELLKPKKKKTETNGENQNSGSTDEKKKRRYKKRLKGLIIKVIVLIVGITLLLTVFFSVHLIHGNDMYPSLRDGDLVITYRLVNTYMADHVFEYKVDGQRYYGRIRAIFK